MTKNFILDTNILLQSPSSIYGFADNHVWIPGTVLQELDKFKSSSGEKGYNARECCRILDECRSKGDLRKGVPLPNKGKLFVEPDGVSNHLLPNGYDLSVPDNRILSTCLYLMKSQKTPEDLTGVGLVPSKIMKMYKGPVILVTNDISMRINASSCGIEVQSYKNDHIE